MSNLKKIGAFIADLRIQKNITQSGLAELLGTTQSSIARIETGKQNISAEMLYKISDVLHRPMINLPDTVNFKIEGGKKLRGEVTTNTSKNGAVFLLCASLLNRGKTTLRNVPKIEEVHRIIEVLTSIGVNVKWIDGEDVEIIPPSKLNLENINIQSAIKTRSIILFIGGLIHLLDDFEIPQAGGCKLGERIIKPHLYVLENLGINISTLKETYKISVKKLKPASVVMYESGDTATGNAIMAASKLKGTTVINMASSNYQVQELCNFLLSIGVRIEGIGTHQLIIHGKPDIDEDIEYELSEDPIDSMLYLSVAATTNSPITILRCPIDFLKLELLKLEKMGFKYKIINNYKGENGIINLVDIKVFETRGLTALEEKIHPLPYPGLNIDNLPFFVPIAARAKGSTLIHDWVYENRAIHYTELSKLGADIKLIDPHRVQLIGSIDFQPTEIICPPALRPAAIILIAMLSAKGTSTLRNVYVINRGYEEIHNKLNSLGADIKIF